MTDEPEPHEWEVAAAVSPADAPSAAEPSAPEAISEAQQTELESPPSEEPSGDRADSIAPMSSPIVTVGSERPLASDSQPPRRDGTGSEPPAPSVRRLVPPPKPKVSPSQAPAEPERPPHFPPATAAATTSPSRVPHLTPIPDLLRTSGWTPPPAATPEQLLPARSTVPQNVATKPLAGNSPTAASAVPASTTLHRPSPAGALPQPAAPPAGRLSSRPPPTLPTGASPSRYPWMAPGAGEGTDSTRPREPAASVSDAKPDRDLNQEANLAPNKGRSLERREPGTATSGPAITAARPDVVTTTHADPNESPSAPRAALLPRATREAVHRQSTPPPKPRIVPPRPPKETSSVAIQAMRIIAIGTDDVAQPEPEPPNSLSYAPSEPPRPPTGSQPELNRSDGEAIRREVATATAPSAQPAHEQRQAHRQSVADAGAPTAPAEVAPPSEPLGLELYPLPSDDAQPDEATPPNAASRASAGSTAPLGLREPLAAKPQQIDIVERAADSVDLVEAEPLPSARRRPPPPRRNSIPSSSGESDPRIALSIPQAVPSEPAPAPLVPAGDASIAELGPRQPPPAPSRVPREPPPRPIARPDLQDRAQATTNASEPPDKPKARTRRPWWEELFGEDFARATAPLSDAQIDQEVSFIEESLGVAPGGAVLDVGCGAGHHAVELARRGYGVVGYDLSLHQLALAQETAHEHNQKINFLQGDMREMAFEEVFDGMYCWNTTFGFFEEDKNVQVIERMFAALKPGGTLLLDVVNRDFVALDQPSSVWYEGDACVCMDDMSVDFFTSRLRVKRSLILDDGRTRECHYSVRLYSLHELGRILHDAGFRVTEASGHATTPGVFLGQTSPRLIVLAQKP